MSKTILVNKQISKNEYFASKVPVVTMTAEEEREIEKILKEGMCSPKEHIEVGRILGLNQ